jgi:hypothetical protein
VPQLVEVPLRKDVGAHGGFPWLWLKVATADGVVNSVLVARNSSARNVSMTSPMNIEIPSFCEQHTDQLVGMSHHPTLAPSEFRQHSTDTQHVGYIPLHWATVEDAKTAKNERSM